MYYALIGDIIGSKRLTPEQRAEAQAKLSAALQQVGTERSEEVAAKFIITLGDEFQGLMHGTGDPVSAALAVLHALRPYEIRIAVGCGDIVTPINREAAIGADGPAFHNARRMIEAMKPRHGARLRFALPDADTEDCVNTVSALCDRLLITCTDKQEELVYAMLTSRITGEKLTQTELARAAGVGQSTVNSQLASAGFNEYCAGIMFIRRQLADYIDKKG